MARIGLVVSHIGLAAVADQKAALESAGIDQSVTLAPHTQEDWYYQPAEVFANFAPGDVLVVSALNSLGLNAEAIFAAIRALQQAGIGLVSVSEQVDTTVSPEFYNIAIKLADAIEAGKAAKVLGVIEQAAQRGAVTPPKAEFVPENLLPESAK